MEHPLVWPRMRMGMAGLAAACLALAACQKKPAPSASPPPITPIAPTAAAPAEAAPASASAPDPVVATTEGQTITPNANSTWKVVGPGDAPLAANAPVAEAAVPSVAVVPAPLTPPQPYTAQPCRGLPLGSDGLPVVTSLPVRSTRLGPPPFVGSLPSYTVIESNGPEGRDALAGPLGSMTGLQRLQAERFAVGGDLVHIPGRLYRLEYSFKGVSDGWLQQVRAQFEQGVVELGAVCVTHGISAELSRRHDYDLLIGRDVRGLPAGPNDHAALKTWAIRTAQGVVWIQSILSEQRYSVSVLVQGSVPAGMLAPREREFFVPPPPPPPSAAEAQAQRPIPPFNPYLDYRGFEGVFRPVLAQPGRGGQLHLQNGMYFTTTVEGPDAGDASKAFRLPYGIKGNTIAVVGPHAELEIRIVDHSTIVVLPPGGGSSAGGSWLSRVR